MPSPTFTMIQEHRGRLPLYHIALYRLEELGLDDMGIGLHPENTRVLR